MEDTRLVISDLLALPLGTTAAGHDSGSSSEGKVVNGSCYGLCCRWQQRDGDVVKFGGGTGSSQAACGL